MLFIHYDTITLHFLYVSNMLHSRIINVQYLSYHYIYYYHHSSVLSPFVCIAENILRQVARLEGQVRLSAGHYVIAGDV